jgi:pilus assembly protein Flp/PilA
MPTDLGPSDFWPGSAALRWASFIVAINLVKIILRVKPSTRSQDQDEGRVRRFLFTGSTSMVFLVKRFVVDENGATAIEYGLIAALISVVIIGALTAVGTNLNGVFGSVSNALGSN